MNTKMNAMGMILLLGSAAALGAAGCAASVDDETQEPSAGQDDAATESVDSAKDAIFVGRPGFGYGAGFGRYGLGYGAGYGLGYGAGYGLGYGAGYSSSYVARSGFGYYGGGFGLW